VLQLGLAEMRLRSNVFSSKCCRSRSFVAINFTHRATKNDDLIEPKCSYNEVLFTKISYYGTIFIGATTGLSDMTKQK